MLITFVKLSLAKIVWMAVKIVHKEVDAILVMLVIT